VFADHNGLTLYDSEADTLPGVSNCYQECAEIWKPFVAPVNAVATGEWSIIERRDGTRQWAFRGKPIYTHNADEDVNRGGRGYGAGSVEVNADQPVFNGNTRGHDVDGHAVVELQPSEWTHLPLGITISEIRTAQGQVLSTPEEYPLYAFDGSVDDPTIGAEWTPMEAPQLALPVGDFTVVARADGLHQWAYQGKPLFRYAGDLLDGDSNGRFAEDTRFSLAYVMKYFIPDQIQIRTSHRFGGLLETADRRTIYVRENGGDGADSPQRAARGSQSTGMRIGIGGCDAGCEETWKPVLTDGDDKPAGYFTIYERKDGRRQWAYFGYALYTYADEPPGETYGHMIYDDVDNFELLPDGQERDVLRLRWRTTPP